MKTVKTILAFILIGFCLTSCVVDDDAVENTNSASSAASSNTTTAAVTAVSVKCGASTVSYNGTATFTASATTSGSPTLSYSWSISKGSDYASISGSGTTATLMASNTSGSEQTITVKVVVSDGSNSVSGTASVTVSATTVKDELTAISLEAACETISATGKTKLSATPTYTGSPSITYSWEITNGSDYAYFTSEGEGSSTKTTVDDGDCKITANNTSDSAQSVTITVTATDSDGNSFSDDVTITILAKGATSDSYNDVATVDTSTYSSVIYVDLESALVSSDNVTWSEITTSAVKPIDNVKVKFTENDDGSSTGLIKINAASFSGKLAVYLSGKMSTGGVKIQSNASDVVAVYLNDAEITSSNYPCVEVTKGSSALVDISGTNVFVDGRTYGTGYGEEYSTSSSDTYTDDDGNIVSCTVVKAAQREGSGGKGTLYSKGNLTISGSGSLSVTQAYKNCIASKDGILTIDGGTLTLQNYLSSSTKSSATGKNGLFGGQGIVVNDGSITFNGYGIISTSDIRKANGFKTDDDDYTSSYVKINGGTVNVTTYNGKGINAPVVAIAGGRNTFTVTGITSYSERTSTGSWYDADGVKETGTVKFAPEGIEGASSVTFSGGTTIVSAPDDGVNVSTTGGTLTISGGFVYVKSQGDGLDSNGNIVISGGTAVVSQTGGGNSPIDCGDGSYSFKVTGTSATVFAMGSSDMFSESIPSSTVSPMIFSTSLGSSSSSLGINGIIAVKSPQTYAAAILISNSLTNGSSYSFVKDGTISGTLYNSDAGVYFPATVSGGTSVSATATTSSSSAGGNTSGSNFPGSGGFSGGGKR